MVKVILAVLAALVVFFEVAVNAPTSNPVKNVAQCYNRTGMITSCAYSEVTGVGK